jgi:DHA1 family bicyclomycin/chloramphenicol resistance-like MFS transporter
MLRPGSFALTSLLALLTGIGPLSVDMYLPSWPEMARLLNATPAQVQLTISVYLVGFGLGQVIYGPLSDRHGRKPVLMGAIALFVLASVICTVAPSIEVLIVARTFQALGGAGMMVLPRAIARDMHEGVYVAREMARMAAVMALTPVIAPFAGGVLQTAFGWRSNFVCLTGFGLVTAALVWWLLPESLRARAPEPISLTAMLRVFGEFLQNRYFLAHLGLGVCAFIGLFTWISSAGFVMQDIYGLSPFSFGLAFAIGSCGYLVGTFLGSHLVTRIGIDRTIGLGTVAFAAGGIGAILALMLGLTSVMSIVLPVSLYLAGLGLAFPLAQAGALLPFPKRAGAASSLVGFVQQSSGAITGAVVGQMLGQSAWPLAAGLGIAGGLAVATWALTRNARASSGQERP